MAEPVIINSTQIITTLQGGAMAYDLFYASNNETTFILHNGAQFLLGSTMVYVNNSYQSFTSYTEVNGVTIVFNSPVANGAVVEVRYIQPVI